jgi:hypothetical protein
MTIQIVIILGNLVAPDFGAAERLLEAVLDLLDVREVYLAISTKQTQAAQTVL